MITTLSFDGDGTLWDFDRAMRRALGLTLAELRRWEPDARVSQLDVDAMVAIRNATATELQGKETNLERIRLHAFRRTLAPCGIVDEALACHLNAFYLQHRFSGIELYPDVILTLDRLKTRFIIGLLSNGNSYPDRCGLADFFRFVVFSQDYGIAKPDPGIFEIVMAQAACSAGELLHIGDSLECDVAGAHNAGARSVWLNRGRVPNATGITPNDEITSLSELIPLCERL